jgi:cell wall-associated NlpC family hydrolase
MAERKDKHVQWEDAYVDKLSFLKKLYEERIAFLSTFVLPGADEADTASDSAGGGSVAGLTPGNTNVEKAWNFFAKKGFTAAATAGVLGNLKQESGIDPTKKQLGGGPGRGLCQWESKHKNGGGRWEALVAWAKNAGMDEWSIDAQLEYLWLELNGKDPTTLSLLNKNWGGIEGLKNATDYKWAVDAFEKSFERAGKPNLPRRYEFAKEFLDQYGNGNATAVANIVGGATGDAKLVLEIAQEWLSKPNRYVLGSGRNISDIKAGKFDCSSWVRYVFEQAGVNIGPIDATTTKTLIKLGKSVSTEDLKPGDLAFFDTTSNPPGHVTIYLGGGKCIGSQSSNGVGVFDMHSNYWGSKIHKEHRRVL